MGTKRLAFALLFVALSARAQSPGISSIPWGACNQSGCTMTGSIVLPNGLTSAVALQIGGVSTGLYSSGANTFRIIASTTVLQTFSSTGTVFNMAATPSGDFTLDLGSAAARWRNIYTGRQITGAATPTVASTGTGTGPTNTVDTGSSDLAGTITVAAGTTPAATGTITVTFSVAAAYGTNAPVCIGMLGNGTGSWNARASLIAGTYTTTSAIFNWDNNAVNLTAASTYKLHYQCIGK